MVIIVKIAVISFSVCGAKLAEAIISALSEQGDAARGYTAGRYAGRTPFEGFSSVYELTARLFDSVNALVFIGACGIAVRAVAPLIKSKLTDPAVIVCDETGRFAVSLLSGHAGGANPLTGRIAGITGAIPVITTASDVHALRSGAEQPKSLVLGIGCRRGLPAETIERAVTIMLWDNKLPLKRVCEAATVDIKRNEKGLTGFADAHGIPLRFFSAEELSGVKGGFSSSERVLKAVGVDNVCERAAVLCGGKGRLIMKKSSKDGVTTAVFERARF